MIPSKSLLLQTIILFLSLIQNVESALNTNDCKKVILKKNELYCDFRNINSFFIGQNSDNLTNTDTFQKHEDLIIFSDGPQIFSKDDIVINMKFRENIDKNEICSLIYNTPINTYFVNCIQTQPTFIIDNKVQMPINTQFNLQIQDVDNFNCSQFDHYTEGFIIFCYSFHQIKLYQISKEQDKLQQTVIFESEYMNLQCLIKFHSFSDSFLIIYYQCLNWKIQIYENNSFKLEIDQHVLKEKYNIEGNLLEILPCQSSFVILLSSGGYQFRNEEFKNLFVTEDLKLNEAQITFDQQCLAKFAVKTLNNNNLLCTFSKKFTDILFNTKDFPKEIFQIQFPQSLFLKYDDYFIFYVNQILQQTIKIKIKNLFQLQNQRIFIGIGEQNQIKLILIKYLKYCLPFYNENKEYSKHYLQFDLKYNQSYTQNNYQNCYTPIIINNDEQKKEYSSLINLENKNYYTERTNYEEQFYIHFFRSSFSSIQPYKITCHSSLQQIKLQEKTKLVKCQFNQYLKNYQGNFIIKTQNSNIYSIIVQGNGNYIVEYNCGNKNNHIYQNILPLNEQIILKFDNSNTLLLLDQQKKCLYKVVLVDVDLKEMPIKIGCLESEVEKIFNLDPYITLQLKDQFVFYNLKYTQDQLIFEQAQLPKQITQNYQEIYQISLFFYIVVYPNELHLIYNQGIIQIINITGKVLGYMTKSYHSQLVKLILLDVIKNEIQFYLVSITDFQQIKSYYLENYVPIEPFQIKIQDSILIITCQHKINNKLFLLIFNCASQITLHLLDQVIETKNPYFWVQKSFLYYFDEKNVFAVQDLLYITFEIEHQKLNDKISQEVMLQLQVELETSEIPPVNKEIMIQMLNPSILKLIQNNSNLFINNENQEMNFRKFILGKIDNIFLNSNDQFKLKYPLQNEFIMSCSYYCNKFCIQVNNSDYMIFFKVGQSQNTYLVYDMENLIKNLLFIEVIKENQFLLINQINTSTLQISLMILNDQIFTLQKQIDAFIRNSVQEIVLVQNILSISTDQIQSRFLINENDINEVDFSNLNKESQIYTLTSEIYLEVKINLLQKKILINLFQISNCKVEIYQTFEISFIQYQIIGLLNGHSTQLESKFIKLLKYNFSQVNQRIDLSLFIISLNQLDIQFQIRLYLKDHKYELINNKILRKPESQEICSFILIDDEEIILQCGITRYYYDMKNGDYLYDPIHSTKILQKMEILNSTHYLFQTHFQHNQSIVLYAGQRGGYVLQKLSQDITFPITLEFQANSTAQMKTIQETLILQVNQQDIDQNEFSQLKFIFFIIIFVILLGAIINYLYRKHLRKNKEFSKVVIQEISLSTISLQNPSNK